MPVAYLPPPAIPAASSAPGYIARKCPERPFGDAHNGPDARVVRMRCHYGLFMDAYDAGWKIPAWSYEALTRDVVLRARNLHRRYRFSEDFDLPAGDRSTLLDYKGKVFVRGHMAPSGDMPDPARHDTFLLSNVIPQSDRLNSGKWEHIEQTVRQIALQSDDPTYVVTGVIVYSKNALTKPVRPSFIYKAFYATATTDNGVWACENADAEPQCSHMSVASWNRKYPEYRVFEKMPHSLSDNP